ncbi:hypothetical protein [Aureimonas ureilytica]|uniref:hypothetical protein n=1 Tax=Aureimonas ureilytica TaxID=401562 RepID=UPI000375750E|nr:hypothetical protein [Aureimonas ureilytica]
MKIGGLDVDFASGAFAQVETWAQNAATNFRLLFTSPTELAVKLMTEAVDRVAGAFERVGQVFSALSAPIETAKSIIQQLMDAVGSLKSIVDQVLGGENPTVTEDARPSPTGEALTPAPDGGLIVHQRAEIVPAKGEVPAQERQPQIRPETPQDAPASAPQTPTPTASQTVVEPGQSVTRPAAPVAQPRPAEPQPASTPMADLVRAGLQQVEGLSVEFNLSEEQIREKVNGLMSFINSATATAKAMLDITQVIAPANQARAAMSDLERTYTARIDADTSPLMAKLAQAKTAINDFRSSVGGGMAAGGMPPARIAAGNAGR